MTSSAAASTRAGSTTTPRDSLKLDFRSFDGEKLLFDFYKYVKGYYVIGCSSGAKEIVISECVLEDGEEESMQGRVLDASRT